MKWDSSADQHLLLAILSAHKVNVDHDRVAQIVGCTPRACEERIKKLRKLAKECGYEVQGPISLSSKKRCSKSSRGRKGGSGKGKCIDNEDMILYRKGIVSDDIEVKMENGSRIKGEVIETEFEMGGYGYGYGYGYEDTKPFIKRQKMENSSFLFTTNPGTGSLNVSCMQYTDTAPGLGIQLGVPLKIHCESLAPKCSQEGGWRGKEGGPDPNDRGAVPVKKEFLRSINYQHRAPKTCPPKIEHSTEAQRPVEFVEISPASKKDPIVINDDDLGEASYAVCI